MADQQSIQKIKLPEADPKEVAREADGNFRSWGRGGQPRVRESEMEAGQ